MYMVNVLQSVNASTRRTTNSYDHCQQQGMDRRTIYCRSEPEDHNSISYSRPSCSSPIQQPVIAPDQQYQQHEDTSPKKEIKDDSKRKNKKWTLGGLFRRKKKEAVECGSSSDECDTADRKRGFLTRRNSKKQKGKQSKVLVTTVIETSFNGDMGSPKPQQQYPAVADYSYLPPRGMDANKRPPSKQHVTSTSRDSLSGSVDRLSHSSYDSLGHRLTRVPSSSRGSSSSEAHTKKERRIAAKARAEARRGYYYHGNSSDDDSKPECQVKHQSKESLKESTASRRTRNSRTERFIKRRSRDEDSLHKEEEAETNKWSATVVYRESCKYDSPSNHIYAEPVSPSLESKISAEFIPPKSQPLHRWNGNIDDLIEKNHSNTYLAIPAVSTASAERRSISEAPSSSQGYHTDVQERSLSFDCNINHMPDSTGHAALYGQLNKIPKQMYSPSMNARSCTKQTPPPPPPRRVFMLHGTQENRPMSFAFERSGPQHDYHSALNHKHYDTDSKTNSVCHDLGYASNSYRSGSENQLSQISTNTSQLSSHTPSTQSLSYGGGNSSTYGVLSIPYKAINASLSKQLYHSPNQCQNGTRKSTSAKMPYYIHQSTNLPVGPTKIMYSAYANQLRAASHNKDHAYLSDSQLAMSVPYYQLSPSMKRKNASDFWRRKEQEAMRQKSLNPALYSEHISKKTSSAFRDAVRPIQHQPPPAKARLAPLHLNPTDSLSSLSSHSDLSSPAIHLPDEALSTKPKCQSLEDMKPISLMSNPQSKIPTASPLSERKCMNHFEEALNELEAIYKSLHLSDEELLDRAERRDLPTVYQQAAADNKEVHGQTDVLDASFDSVVNNPFRQRAPPNRRSGLPDKVADDMALRRYQQAQQGGTTTPVDQREIIGNAGSYMLLSPVLSPAQSMDTVSKFIRCISPEPDVTTDDVTFRNIRQANAMKVLDPQPPFGIPIGPVTKAADSDYLHAQPSNSPRPTFQPKKSPDIVKDDLAFRNLRKDRDSPIPTSNFHCLKNGSDILLKPTDSMKKKKAVRSLSANLAGLIQRQEVTLSYPQSPGQEFEKAQSYSNLPEAINNEAQEAKQILQTKFSPGPPRLPKPKLCHRKSFGDSSETDNATPRSSRYLEPSWVERAQLGDFNIGDTNTSTETLTDSRSNLLANLPNCYLRANARRQRNSFQRYSNTSSFCSAADPSETNNAKTDVNGDCEVNDTVKLVDNTDTLLCPKLPPVPKPRTFRNNAIIVLKPIELQEQVCEESFQDVTEPTEYKAHEEPIPCERIQQQKPTSSDPVKQQKPTSIDPMEQQKPTSIDPMEQQKPTSIDLVEQQKPTSIQLVEQREPTSSEAELDELLSVLVREAGGSVNYKSNTDFLEEEIALCDELRADNNKPKSAPRLTLDPPPMPQSSNACEARDNGCELLEDKYPRELNSSNYTGLGNDLKCGKQAETSVTSRRALTPLFLRSNMSSTSPGNTNHRAISVSPHLLASSRLISPRASSSRTTSASSTLSKSRPLSSIHNGLHPNFATLDGSSQSPETSGSELSDQKSRVNRYKEDRRRQLAKVYNKDRDGGSSSGAEDTVSSGRRTRKSKDMSTSPSVKTAKEEEKLPTISSTVSASVRKRFITRESSGSEETSANSLAVRSTRASRLRAAAVAQQAPPELPLRSVFGRSTPTSSPNAELLRSESSPRNHPTSPRSRMESSPINCQRNNTATSTTSSDSLATNHPGVSNVITRRNDTTKEEKKEKDKSGKRKSNLNRAMNVEDVANLSDSLDEPLRRTRRKRNSGVSFDSISPRDSVQSSLLKTPDLIRQAQQRLSPSPITTSTSPSMVAKTTKTGVVEKKPEIPPVLRSKSLSIVSSGTPTQQITSSVASTPRSVALTSAVYKSEVKHSSMECSRLNNDYSLFSDTFTRKKTADDLNQRFDILSVMTKKAEERAQRLVKTEGYWSDQEQHRHRHHSPHNRLLAQMSVFKNCDSPVNCDSGSNFSNNKTVDIRKHSLEISNEVTVYDFEENDPLTMNSHSVSKRKSLDESLHNNSTSTNIPQSILKRKTSREEREYASSPSLPIENHPQSILKKKVSVDDSIERRHSLSPDLLELNGEFKPILRRSSLDGRHQLVDDQQQPQSILKRKSSREEIESGTCSPEPQGILKRKSSSVTSGSIECLDNISTGTSTPVEPKPILKKNRSAEELVCAANERRPILKKKSSTEDETQDDIALKPKPILKPSRKSLEDLNNALLDDDYPSILKSARSRRDKSASPPRAVHLVESDEKRARSDSAPTPSFTGLSHLNKNQPHGILKKRNSFHATAAAAKFDQMDYELSSILKQRRGLDKSTTDDLNESQRPVSPGLIAAMKTESVAERIQSMENEQLRESKKLSLSSSATTGTNAGGALPKVRRPIITPVTSSNQVVVNIDQRTHRTGLMTSPPPPSSDGFRIKKREITPNRKLVVADHDDVATTNSKSLESLQTHKKDKEDAVINGDDNIITPTVPVNNINGTMGVDETTPATTPSVLRRANMFMQMELDQRKPPTDVKGARPKRFLNRKERLLRSSTQPVTFEEVEEAAKLNPTSQDVNESEKAPVDNDEPSKLSLADRVHLFSTKIIEQNLQPKALDGGSKRRSNARFKTQPVTSEDLQRASSLVDNRVSVTINGMLAPPVTGILKNRPLSCEIEESSSRCGILRRNSFANDRRGILKSESTSTFINTTSSFTSHNNTSSTIIRGVLRKDSSFEDYEIKSILKPESDFLPNESSSSSDTDIPPGTQNLADEMLNVEKNYMSHNSSIIKDKSDTEDGSSSGGREVRRIIKNEAVARRLQASQRKNEKRVNDEPMPKIEIKGCEHSMENMKLADRLARLQEHGENDWQKRISPTKLEINGCLSPPPRKSRSFENNNHSDIYLEKEPTLENGRPSSIADLKSKLEVSKEGWKQRVEEKDSAKFTVAGKMEMAGKTIEPILQLPSPAEDKKKRTPKPVRIRSKTACQEDINADDLPILTKASVRRCMSVPDANRINTKNGDTSESSDLSGSCSPEALSSPISAPKIHIISQQITSSVTVTTNKTSTTSGHLVQVPKADDDDFSAFFTNVQDLQKLEENKLDFGEGAFDMIKSEDRQMLVQRRSVQVQRRKAVTSRNPIKALSMRSDLQDTYEEVHLGIAEKEVIRLNVEKLRSTNSNLAIAALAGLASKEDFTGVKLKRSGSAASNYMLPYQDLMLLQVKGRRHVQTRLIEPKAENVNSGDTYVLVTPEEVFTWKGEFSNVIECNRGAEISQIIQQKKDLGCKNSKMPITIECGTSSKQVQKFWQLLNGSEASSPKDTGSPDDEDQCYENAVIETNMVYEVVKDELVQVEEFWGQIPKYEILDTNKVLIFDFGSELYIWSGQKAPMPLRKTGENLARVLWNEGFDYGNCMLNPIYPIFETSAAKKGKKRPSWCLLARVNEHMETVLFREKFLDWPDFSRVIKVKRDENEKTEISNLKPCDVKDMLKAEHADPNLQLEGCSLGRGTQHIAEEENREYRMSTLGLKVWQIQEYEKVPIEQSSWGHFYSAETYVIHWLYRVIVSGRDLSGHQSKHAVTGRDRSAYFFWQGRDSTVNEQGAAALMTVELHKDQGAQERVEQGREPPAFLQLFGGKMVLHKGKRDQTEDDCRLFIARGEQCNEGCLVEVALGMEHLRSRSSFLLVNRSTNTIHLWHGCQSLDHTKEIVTSAANHIASHSPIEFRFKEDNPQIQEEREGAESEGFLTTIGGNKEVSQQYISLLSREGKITFTPRLFQMTSTSGTFVANPILCSYRFKELTCAFPFLQDDLYQDNQPVLMLVDNDSIVWLWHGWWPEGDEENENTSTGSGRMRFAAERRCAMEVALQYCVEKNPDRTPPLARQVWAGLEPMEFINLFPSWMHREEVAELNKKEGHTPGEMILVSTALASLTRTVYSLAELKSEQKPEGVEPSKLEAYLCDEEFEKLLEFTKTDFYALPTWKQNDIKKDCGLF